MASNSIDSSASVFTLLLAGDYLNSLTALTDLTPRLAAISHQTNLLLFSVTSKDPHDHSCSSLYGLGTNYIGNTSPNCSIVMSHSYHMDHDDNTTSQLLHWWVLWKCSLATGMFTEPLPSNNCYIAAYFMVIAKQWVYMPQYWQGMVKNGFFCMSSKLIEITECLCS
jgi:hypothetical protein